MEYLVVKSRTIMIAVTHSYRRLPLNIGMVNVETVMREEFAPLVIETSQKQKKRSSHILISVVLF